MINIAICDDSEYSRKEISGYLLEYSMRKEFEYQAYEFESGEKLLASDKEYDLILMDYEFGKKGKDGIAIASAIRQTDQDVAIVFLSGYPEAVFDSFDVNAFRFLLKPINREKFDSMLDSFVSTLKDEGVLCVSSGGTHHYIKEHRILYIESDRKNSIIHLLDKSESITSHEPLTDVESRLSSDIFYRCYKSYIVNLEHIVGNDRKNIYLDDGESVMLSRAKYNEFVNLFSKYIMRNK